METVTLSSKFQIVIPRAVRESMDIKPGEKLQIILYGDRIELLPLKPASKLRGFLKGIDTSLPRENGRV